MNSLLIPSLLDENSTCIIKLISIGWKFFGLYLETLHDIFNIQWLQQMFINNYRIIIIYLVAPYQ